MSEAQDGDTLYLTGEVAERMRQPIETLRYWRHIGYGPRSFKLGRRVVYAKSDVEAWIDQQRADQTA